MYTVKDLLESTFVILTLFNLSSYCWFSFLLENNILVLYFYIIFFLLSKFYLLYFLSICSYNDLVFLCVQKIVVSSANNKWLNMLEKWKYH